MFKELESYHWVNNDVKIADFFDELPKVVQNLIIECEQMDAEENYAYVNLCESVEDVAKLFVPDGIIKKEHFNKICCRYWGI